jgi:hypothetical protein
MASRIQPNFFVDGGWLQFCQPMPRLDSHHVEHLLRWTSGLASPLRYTLKDNATVMIGEYPIDGAVDAALAEVQLQRRLDWDWPRTTIPNDESLEAALALAAFPFQRAKTGWLAVSGMSGCREELQVRGMPGGARVEVRLGQIPDDAEVARDKARLLSVEQQGIRFARIEIQGQDYILASEAAAEMLAYELPLCISAVSSAYQLLTRPDHPTLRPRPFWQTTADDEWRWKFF